MNKKGETQVLGLVLVVILAFIIAGMGYLIFQGFGDNESNSSDKNICSQDIKDCGNGTYVSRNVSINCEFDICQPFQNKTENVQQ